MRMPEPVVATPLTAEKKEEKLDRKEEELQPKAEASISDKIQCKQEPERKLQAKACSCGGQDEHTHIHTKPDPAVSTPHNGSNISLFPSEVMRQSDRGPPVDSIPFEQTLASSKGGGSALPSDTRGFMESRMGADFSGVRIHTGTAAESLSRRVNAQAFAHGSDIYFNSGKYSPDTSTGKTLLAHELTHTVQQGAARTLRPAVTTKTHLTQTRITQAIPSLQRKCAACTHKEKLYTHTGVHINRKPADNRKKETSAPLPTETILAPKNQKNLPLLPTTVIQQVSSQAPAAPSVNDLPVADRTALQGTTPAVPPAAASAARVASAAPRDNSNASAGQANARPGATGSAIRNPASLLQSLGSASYSNFAQALNAASTAVPAVHQYQKGQLAQNLPRIQRPTGLPAASRSRTPATRLVQSSPSNLQTATGTAEMPASFPQQDLSATQSFYAGHAATPVAEPVTANDDDNGSWWSWLTGRISSFVTSLPTSDSGVSTSAGVPPQVNMSGQADPQQNEARQQMAHADVTNGVTQGDNATSQPFGEHDIYPSSVPETLQPSHNPSAAQTRNRKVHQQPVPPYARTAYDQATQPLLARALGEKTNGYQQQELGHQQRSAQAKEQGLQNIEQEDLHTRDLQQHIRLSAQTQVNAQRQLWRQQNTQVQQRFDTQSEAKRAEVNIQIQSQAQTAEQESARKLTEAENRAESEKQKAETEVQRKKQEAENKPQSWWESFKGAVSAAFNAIRSAVNAVFDALRQAVRVIIQAAHAVVNAIIDAARNAITGLIRAFGDALRVMIDLALAQFPEIARRAREFIDELVNSAVDAVDAAADALKEVASGILDDLGDALYGLLSELQDTFNEIMDQIADMARGLVDLIENGIVVHLPDMTLFDRLAGHWDLPRLSTGDIALAEVRIEDPDDPCIFIAANLFVRGELKPSLDASLGPGTLSSILIRLNPFASFYQGSAVLRIPASGTVTMVVTGMVGGKAFYTCGDIARVEGGLEGTGTAGLQAIFEAYPVLTYDGGNISFTASPSLETCLPLSFSLDAIARASLLDKYKWEGSWHLFDKVWSKCWKLQGAGAMSGSLPGGGGRSGGGGAGGSWDEAAQSMRFKPEAFAAREMFPAVLGKSPQHNDMKAARKGICNEVDDEGKKVDPCEDGIGPTGATYACAICKCSGDKECGGGRIHTIWMGKTECNRNNKAKAQQLCNHDSTFKKICDLSQKRPDGKKCMVHHHDFACGDRETEDKCKNRQQAAGASGGGQLFGNNPIGEWGPDFYHYSKNPLEGDFKTGGEQWTDYRTNCRAEARAATGVPDDFNYINTLQEGDADKYIDKGQFQTRSFNSVVHGVNVVADHYKNRKIIPKNEITNARLSIFTPDCR